LFAPLTHQQTTAGGPPNASADHFRRTEMEWKTTWDRLAQSAMPSWEAMVGMLRRAISSSSRATPETSLHDGLGGRPIRFYERKRFRVAAGPGGA